MATVEREITVGGPIERELGSARARPHMLTLRRAASSPSLVAGIVILGILLFAATFAELIAPYDPVDLNIRARLQPPSLEHLLGTDDGGRDVLSRLIYGARISLVAALIIQFVALAIGISVGHLAGYVGGVMDDVFMRITDMFLAFPSVVLAMAMAVALGPGLVSVIIALALVGWWPGYARLVRGQVLSVKEYQFVLAAHAIGVPPIKIMFRHILPNISLILLVKFTLDMGFTILALASLSFIGVGAQTPTPEWGEMIRAGNAFLLTAWWWPTFTGLAILFAVVGFNFLGDGLADVFDPVLRKKI